jgi:hypothetical protein
MINSASFKTTRCVPFRVPRLLGVAVVSRRVEKQHEESLVLFRSDGSSLFWTADSPVALQNTVNPGDGIRGTLGLAVPGIEVYLPISKDLVLAHMCPSIASRTADSGKMPVAWASLTYTLARPSAPRTWRGNAHGKGAHSISKLASAGICGAVCVFFGRRFRGCARDSRWESEAKDGTKVRSP